MKIKKALALALASVLTFSVLAACGKEPSSTAAGGPSSAAANASQNASQESSAPAQDGATTKLEGSWSKDKSEHTISWFFVYDWYGKKFTPDTNLFDKQLFENTGCKIDIQTGDVDKLNLLIKTGKLPDVVTIDANSTQRTLLEDNDMVLPLETLREKEAPDLKIPQSMIDWYRNDNGHWYSIASYYYGEDNVKENKGFFETHNQNYVRDDILKEIGMSYDDLRTKKGFTAALRAVRDKNISYNGQTVIPYMVQFRDVADTQVAEQFGGSYEDKAGNYQSIVKTPQYKEAMLFFNELYREGLLTDESFTVDRPQIEQEIGAGRVFASTAKTNVSKCRDTLYARDNKALIYYAGQFTGDSNQKVMVPAKSNGGWTATMISKNAKNPERIIRLFAYLNTKEACLDNNWGVGGWKLENGMVVRPDEYIKAEESNPKDYALKYTGDMGWTTDYTVIQGTYPRDNSVWSEDVYKLTHDDRIIIYDDKCFTDVAPLAGSDEAAIDARIKEYKAQAIGRIITAASAEACEAELNTMLSEMDKLGLSKLDTYKNTRFQKNKQRLGVKFAFPGNAQ